MHEKKKIREAKYFYSRMLEMVNDLEVFTYYLNAFLSSSRSVLLYALEEAKGKANGQVWYDNRVNNAVLKFFKEKRDTTIHVRPVVPRQNTGVTPATGALSINVSDSHSTIVIDGKETKRVPLPPSPPPPISPEIKPETSVTYQYCFADWNGPEDVLSLCEKYLLELEVIVDDGIAKGFLTDQ